MRFVYHPKSGEPHLLVEGEVYHHLFRVRRHGVGELIPFRNLRDGWLYYYEVVRVDRRRALLELRKREWLEVKPSRFFHLGWCIVDPKSVEKSLPILNEIGVGKITFLPCQRSQRSYRLNFQKLEKILILSCQQCGRSDLMELEELASVEELVRRYPQMALLDFGGEKVSCGTLSSVLVGPEGGFVEQERSLFGRIAGLGTPLVLRSESAAVAVSSLALLG